MAIHGANLVRYETYDFTGNRVSQGKYMSEEKMWKDFEHREDTNLKFLR